MKKTSDAQTKEVVPSTSGIDDRNSKVSLKSVLGILGAIAGAIILYYLLPGGDEASGGLSSASRSLAAIFLAALVLWATEAIPIAVTSLLVLILAPLLGVVESIKGAAVGFTSPVVYFVIASFILSAAVEKSGLGQRFALFLITSSGTGSRKAVLVLMFGSAITSSIMSNVPACAIFMSLALPILIRLNAQPGRSNLGKAIMMGIPIASFTGGIATPSGSSTNILALSLLKEKSGIDVSFIQWMAIGIPMFLIMTVVAWWIIIKLVPPEVDSIGDIKDFRNNRKQLGSLSMIEKKTIAIIAVTVVLWVLSSWIKQLDIVMIAIASAAVMFLPGIRLLEWKTIEKSIGWDSVLMIGSVTSLGLAASNTGLSKWVVANTLGGISEWHIFWAILLISAFTVVIHLPVPMPPSICAAIIPAIVALAAGSGVNAAMYALPVAFTASCAFLLPLDAVPLVTYSKGYYKMLDMFVPGSLISVVWIVVITALTVVLGPALGFR